MRRFTIQKLMLAIAIIAAVLGGWVGVMRFVGVRVYDGCTRTNQCASNLHNIAIALTGYHNNQEAFPSGTVPNPNLPPEKRLSWCAVVTPFLDTELYSSTDVQKSWDHPTNDFVAQFRLANLTCPNISVPANGYPATPYIGIAGVGTDAPFLPKGHPRAGVFGYDRRTALADITDGAGWTMIVAESVRVRGSWLTGGPATVRGLDTAEMPYIGPGRQFGGVHPSGMYAAFADGSVRFLSDTINPRVLEAWSTIAGGETLPP